MNLLLTPEELFELEIEHFNGGYTKSVQFNMGLEIGAKAQLAKLRNSPEFKEQALHILIESIRAAEMRQGCTNHTYYAEILFNQIQALLTEEKWQEGK